MSNSVYVCVDTYWDTLTALRDFHREREKEKMALLNSIVLIESELAKPEYFGYIIERDRIGYLEALSKTKTTFRGINPHDPLNGMVVNGELNPDFMMMLEENFFRVNSKKLSIDELNFVRYEAERDEMIDWLRGEFRKLAIDDKYLQQEIGINQEYLFKKLQRNEWVWGVDANNGSLSILDKKQYLKGLENQELLEMLPHSFCTQNEIEECKIDVNSIFQKIREILNKKKALEEEQRALENERRYQASLPFRWILVLICLCGLVYIFLGN